MTKDEVLQCQDTSHVWQAMQDDPVLKDDMDVWMHMNRLMYEKNRREVIERYGSYKLGDHIDYVKK